MEECELGPEDGEQHRADGRAARIRDAVRAAGYCVESAQLEMNHKTMTVVQERRGSSRTSTTSTLW